ncbi:hypothetical protein EJ06DRAFT_484217, partial [Trichodelitschia bisporula]
VLLLMFVDSFIFCFVSGVIRYGVGVNISGSMCHASILLCLTFYLTTKILLYYYFVEKAVSPEDGAPARLTSKRIVGGRQACYSTIFIITYLYRIHFFNVKGMCVIGIARKALIPMIVFEIVINCYLTGYFVVHVRALYSYRTNSNPKLRRIAVRSLIGSFATLTSSVTNLSVLAARDGELAWVCLTCCLADSKFY